uniref:Turripeptide UID-02 n=1 Tax=Gemmula speciosa TaxID=439592 RepID=TU2_GEMSP|nr:RecName: Full=Turripeptide UID-02; Flags: Precursor [Gemmula speciosa]ADE28867.1 putative turritoxin UID-02 precursor [Gemmula speciosa]
MGFYMLLTVALLLTSLMNVEATPVDQAERSALEKSGLGNRIQPRYDNCGDAEQTATSQSAWTKKPMMKNVKLPAIMWSQIAFKIKAKTKTKY